MAVIVKNGVRDLVRGEFNVSQEYLKKLDAEVRAKITRASDRARMNGRKTLKARDV
jgi:hypothetical protein